MVRIIRDSLRQPGDPPHGREVHKRDFDPELMYAECARCGRPLLWEQGRSTLFVAGTGVAYGDLDMQCMIISDGCPRCQPERTGYRHRIVRVGSVEMHDALLDDGVGGTA
ncbi:hypothetical protein [Nitratidesulfovibrio vulgaris]|jgi:hypothetical protein|uniref:Uncharacterized protein n=2 Tax=Nitratidesulfovibrio vulgaris TaxID=881 RepID=Q72ET2_NITV2|nr:hypothetical protein [Nitratidesulfovibrio vulgaris]GEB80671.1 hypothetical protein DDE01_20860 [Desulfovibrio desulfuricans]HBW17134.1 hypothetical protein [Desulfovibrio sp.]AAS94969.1 hypothetical protein DVU_0486 [Nitratidesulfovibrio vulgaris str. Hildenborough]ABM29471.1 conserved hypothetical protein [Nitratidesulfovibrio vulgaris DP4]ADP85614.1 hypothetical protein Deval_0444 [Nitratidesulfovibrio vulgaris RCH1]